MKRGEKRNKINSFLEENKNILISKFENNTSIYQLSKEIKCSISYLCKKFKLWGLDTSKYKEVKLLADKAPNWTGYGDISGVNWSHIKYTAQKRNKVFDITIEDAWFQFEKQAGLCALSGILLSLGKSFKNKNNGNASLDRIDSKKGYTKDNIQWIDKKINRMKSDLNEKEFLEFCKLITEFQKLAGTSR